MNIALCSVGELFGGVERQIVDLCEFLEREYGVAPTVVLFFDRHLAAQLRSRGIDTVIVRGRHRYDPRLVGALRKILTDRAVDVVHVHGYKATVGCGLALRNTRVGLVKTEHGKPEATPRRPLAWLKSRLNFRLEHAITRRRVDEVCYVTRDIENCYAHLHDGISRRSVHNGIAPLDAASFRRPADLPTDSFNFGIVGRVTPVKGIPFAVEALSRPGIPPTTRLVVIGSGPVAGEIETLARRLGVADRVELLGFRENIYDYLAHLDALLMPSWHEGLPYTLLEAMSLGCPALTSRVGGLAEVLRDGETGLLFEVGDVDGIAAAMGRMAREPELRLRLGEAAAAEQRRLYTLETMGRRYLERYEAAIAQRAR